MSHPKYTRTYKEDFSSVGGSSINLGHFLNKSNSAADFKSNFTMHENVQPSSALALPPKGLKTTKFGPGFHRRSVTQIQQHNSFAAENNQRLLEETRYSEKRLQRAMNTSQERLQTLRQADYRAGYNIINNQEVPEVHRETSASHGQGIKMCGSGLGPEAPHRGKVTLRESEGRYFLPHATGKQHEHRQDVLYREGLLQTKTSAILQLGKRDLPSYGVIDDQFGKSNYSDKNKTEITRQGLYEKSLPGQFTPRKIQGHPAGDAKMIEQWTTSIDLNNRTINSFNNSNNSNARKYVNNSSSIVFG